MKKLMAVLVCALLAQVSLVSAQSRNQWSSVGGTTTNDGGFFPHQKPKEGPQLLDWTSRYGVPVGNWTASGVKFKMVVVLMPNAICDRNFTTFDAERYLQTGNGLVPVMVQPRDLAAVASLRWCDFINTTQGDFYFFRNRPKDTVTGNCEQRGTRVVIMLDLETTQQTDLTKISGGALSDEDESSQNFWWHNVNFSFNELPSYSDYISGVNYGPDGIEGTTDDQVFHNGENAANRINRLRYVGFWFSNVAWAQSDIDDQRDYFSQWKCLSIIVWYRGLGNSGNKLFEGRIDLPVNPSVDPRNPSFPGNSLSIKPANAGNVSLTIGAWKSQVWFIDSAPTVGGQWAPYDLVPRPAGTYQIPATGAAKVFRLRQ